MSWYIFDVIFSFSVPKWNWYSEEGEEVQSCLGVPPKRIRVQKMSPFLLTFISRSKGS